MKMKFPDIMYAESVEDALRDSDAALILTDWEDYKKLTNDHFDLMNKKVIIEGRKVLSDVVDFEGVCW